jgi:hypothetical protein
MTLIEAARRVLSSHRRNEPPNPDDLRLLLSVATDPRQAIHPEELARGVIKEELTRRLNRPLDVDPEDGQELSS